MDGKWKSMSFPSTVRKVSNGYYVNIPKQYLDLMGLKDGDSVVLNVRLPEMVGESDGTTKSESD